jgi:hypothetical protein
MAQQQATSAQQDANKLGNEVSDIKATVGEVQPKPLAK